jgi:hypothetical protein
MKLLYLSCHSILEYDELRLFEELGIDYFSLGSYVVPTAPVDGIRPALTAHPENWLIGSPPPRDNIPQEFIDQFDVIMVMHVPEWIEQNWDKFKKKRVILRTIGQNTPSIEARLMKYVAEGLEIVRYSPREANLDPTAGCSKIIRFYKDEAEFGDWNGAGNEVITFAQDMKHRGEFCNYDAFCQIVKGFNAHVYGPKNENSYELNGGFLTYPDMRQKMRDGRVYVYTGTQPASYVLNLMEAMMTGIPIVAIGPKHATSLNRSNGINGDLYEVQDIIQNGVNGFISDDIGVLRERVQLLLDDHNLARRIGEMGRQKAIELFGKQVIKSKWAEYLKL